MTNETDNIEDGVSEHRNWEKKKKIFKEAKDFL